MERMREDEGPNVSYGVDDAHRCLLDVWDDVLFTRQLRLKTKTGLEQPESDHCTVCLPLLQLEAGRGRQSRVFASNPPRADFTGVYQQNTQSARRRDKTATH